MKEIFVFQENKTYNLRSGNNLARKIIQTIQYVIDTLQISNPLGDKFFH